MHAARLVIGSTALVVLTLAPAREAEACECGATGPACQNAFQVDAVFAGTVVSVSPLPDEGPGETRIPRAVDVAFIAVVRFRGVEAAAVTVRTAGSSAACGYEFAPGERYLVYATRAADGQGFVTSICSRTRRLAEAAEDLDFLQGLSAPARGGARISGTITHWERDLATGEPREHGPVRGVFVAVRGQGESYDAATGARGRYQVRVPPGTYEVTAVPPAGFSTRHLDRAIEVRDAHACFVLDFGVQFDGRIRGFVRHASGAAADGVAVEVMAADVVGRTGRVETLRASTDARGFYEFTEVSPGRYVVGVDFTRRTDAAVVFPTTFHPGTTDAARATVIRLGGGQQRSLRPMTLPPPRRTHQLTGTVVFEDGRPASGATIALREATASARQVTTGIRTGFDGTFSLVVHEGLSYVAQASYWDEAQWKSFSGTAGSFLVIGDTGPLTIVLTGR